MTLRAWLGLCGALLALPAEAYRTNEPTALATTRDGGLDDHPSLTVSQRTERQATDGVTIRYLSWANDGETSRPVVREMRRRSAVKSKGGRREEHIQWLGGKWKVTTDPDVPEWLSKEYNLTHRTLSRCGFTWDDAAAKEGSGCKKDTDCSRPAGSKGEWPPNREYGCYADLPDDRRREGGECVSRDSRQKSDLYCQLTCGLRPGAWCDGSICSCTKSGEAWDLSASIQPHDDSKAVETLPEKTFHLKKSLTEWDAVASGLPACTWQPGKGCSNVTQYECFKGAKAGLCSATNWFGKSACEASCVHVSMLDPAPYYALWNAGPAARPCEKLERVPRYKHNAKKLTLEKRGLNLQQSDVMMSRFCKSTANRFVGVTMYSYSFEEKAARLVRSCERVGVCCKAMMLPGGIFGPDAPEGSDNFRFEVIAMKPSFILSQLDSTQLPVVYLDTDLEFHRFPELFLPGSWPEYDRDVALFNYWGNESVPENKYLPKIGSAVAFFNTTSRAHRLLTAWAEAMAWEGNAPAPDDQVLDLLLSEGDWLRRASFGWLPSAYMRTMPGYYRGIVPVIDHDHGSAPGLSKHSQKKPKYPEVKDMELCDPDAQANKDVPRFVSPEGAEAESDCPIDDRQFCDMQVWNMIPGEAKSREEAIKKISAPGAWTHDQCKNCYADSTQPGFCSKCGVNQMLVPNCCSHGGAWVGKCTVDASEEGTGHTWADGFDACNLPTPPQKTRRKKGKHGGKGKQRHYSTKVKVLGYTPP